MKQFIRKYNGWLGFMLSTAAFFLAPPLYRLIDPTAGQFDAGFIHPIIYASVVICFASGLAWTLVLLTAPGAHKHLDRFFEEPEAKGINPDAVITASILYVVFLLATVACVAVMV